MENDMRWKMKNNKTIMLRSFTAHNGHCTTVVLTTDCIYFMESTKCRTFCSFLVEIQGFVVSVIFCATINLDLI